MTEAEAKTKVCPRTLGPSGSLCAPCIGSDCMAWRKTGEAKDFVKNGNIEVGGRLPLNTHGGQVGEAYIHGFNGIAEAVRQVRGTAVNQIKNVEHIVVTSGNGPPTSGLIMGPG